MKKKLILGGYYKQTGQKKSITTVEKKMILAGYYKQIGQFVDLQKRL